MAHIRDYQEGPLKLLTDSVYNQNKILIKVGNRRKLIANIIGFDSNFNMILINIKEKWFEKCSKSRKWMQKERYLARMFLLGHNVGIVVKL